MDQDCHAEIQKTTPDPGTDNTVALLRQEVSYSRETARDLIHFRLTSSVIRKIVHKIVFLRNPMRAPGQYNCFISKF